MADKIPFSLIPFQTLKKISIKFGNVGKLIINISPSIKFGLEQAKMSVSGQEYIAMSFVSSFIIFIFFSLVLLFFLALSGIKYLLIPVLFITLPFSIFIFLQQIFYPKRKLNKRTKNIEKNLLSALEDLLVQLNSGITLFDAVVNISKKDYGELSKEFAKAVNKINVGLPEISVLDELASNNPSLYFRRAIWQLVNGMKTGANTSLVLEEVISSLTEEQLVQIQKYTGQLNPLVMFYMITTVILPSLGMTFLIIISSFISANEFLTKGIFWIFYIVIVFFQIMFIGIIKTKRPTLLERS